MITEISLKRIIHNGAYSTFIYKCLHFTNDNLKKKYVFQRELQKKARIVRILEIENKRKFYYLMNKWLMNKYSYEIFLCDQVQINDSKKGIIFIK